MVHRAAETARTSAAAASAAQRTLFAPGMDHVQPGFGERVHAHEVADLAGAFRLADVEDGEADQAPLLVECGAAAVAFVDHGVGLDERAASASLETRDDAAADGERGERAG